MADLSRLISKTDRNKVNDGGGVIISRRRHCVLALASANAAEMTASSRSHFTLQDRSITLDERVHAVRGDLADLALAGQIFVPHYARPMHMTCALSNVLVRKGGSADAEASTQLMFGEDFMVLDKSGGWAWGYCRHDHYVGYVPEASLSPGQTSTDSTPIAVREAIVYAVADTGGEQRGTLPIGARVSGTPQGDFFETTLGFVQASAVEATFLDRASVAELLIDTPYVWGGRTSTGIDCSGVVQLACAFADENVPRDTDQQEAVIGTDIPEGAPLQRDDIIFFPGHVGIMVDADRIIHANTFHGKTVIEDLATVAARYSADHDGIGITSRKRLG
jgi:cell wall-associated NlpC family hydrolase